MSFNPYKRLEEIYKEIKELEIIENFYKRKSLKRKPKELEDAERSIMFLCFERIPIEKTIEWFEKKQKKNWRWENEEKR